MLDFGANLVLRSQVKTSLLHDPLSIGETRGGFVPKKFIVISVVQKSDNRDKIDVGLFLLSEFER